MTFVFKSDDNEDGKEREHRFIKEIMIHAIKKHNGNVIKASEYLGLTPRGFNGRRKRYKEVDDAIENIRASQEQDYGKMQIYFKDELWEKKGDKND